MSQSDIRQIRGNKISMIFQDPMTSLNPFLRISTQMIETIVLHQGLDNDKAKEKAVEMLKLAGIPAPEKRIDQYPHQFSGGMRQRVMIAMALSCNPEILIADLEIIKELTHRLGTAVILITHSLGVVAGMCDTLCVMYAGRVVERGRTVDIFEDPKHPYTIGLIKSVPRLDRENSERLYSIQGQPPNVIDLPDCCPFYPRCEKAMDICKQKYPQAAAFENGRAVSCWLYSEAKK